MEKGCLSWALKNFQNQHVEFSSPTVLWSLWAFPSLLFHLNLCSFIGYTNAYNRILWLSTLAGVFLFYIFFKEQWMPFYNTSTIRVLLAQEQTSTMSILKGFCCLQKCLKLRFMRRFQGPFLPLPSHSMGELVQLKYMSIFSWSGSNIYLFPVLLFSQPFSSIELTDHFLKNVLFCGES